VGGEADEVDEGDGLQAPIPSFGLEWTVDAADADETKEG